MAVKYKKTSNQTKPRAGRPPGPHCLLKVKTWFYRKAGRKYFLILISVSIIPIYYGFSNYKSPEAAYLLSIYQADMLPGKINSTQNPSPEITDLKNITAFESHFRGWLTEMFNDFPCCKMIAGARVISYSKVKLKRAKTPGVNAGTVYKVQKARMGILSPSNEPDDPLPLLCVTDTVALLHFRAQMKSYLDSLIMDPKSIGLMTDARRMINSAATGSNACRGLSNDTPQQAIYEASSTK